MAGGNMGDLWFELGIKDGSSKKLNEILKSVQELHGEILKLNKEMGNKKNAQETKKLSNALNYLRMLQQIAQEEQKIKGLQKLSVGGDTTKLEAALKLLSNFREQLLNLQTNGKKGGGGVDSAYITGFQQALRNTLSDVKNLEAAFKNENSLSAFKSNAARLTNELERVKNKLAEIYSMQSLGVRGGFNTASLLGAGNTLRGIKRRIENTLSSPSRLGDETQVKQLLSDIALSYTKASGKIAEYNREKQKSIETSREEAAKQKEIERATEETNRAKRKSAELERQHQQELANTATKIRTDLATAYDRVNQNASRTNELMGELKSLLLQGGIVYGMRNFFNSIIQTGGEIEQQHIALRSILGDKAKADELFAQTQQLALQSPFKFGELNRDTKQLAAFGVEANDLYETTKRIADISSGLGVDFGRLGLAFGQVKARAWLDGKELRQFAYAGLPLLQKITDMYNREGRNGRNNYTTGDVKSMISKREVSFEDVKKVLWELTDEGGQFYNMQFVLSETLLGRYNKLIDAWDIMLGKFASGKNVVGSVMKGMLDGVTNLVLALDKLSPLMLGLGAGFALKKLVGVGATGVAAYKTGGLATQMATLKAAQVEELKIYAIEQQRLVASGAITQQQASALIMKRAYVLADKQTVANQMSELAIQGRLNVFQMQSAYRQGLITKELVQQLQVMGLISAKQAELITKEGILARIKAGANVVGGGLLSFGNLAMIGGTIGVALWQGYSQFKDKIKEDADNIASSAKDRLKSLSDVEKEVSPKAQGAELEQQVGKMKEVLEQSGLYTDSIKEQIEYAQNLQEEYDILKGRILEAKDASLAQNKYAQIIADAKSASGMAWGKNNTLGWLFGLGNDTFETNIDDIATPLARIKIGLESLDEETKKRMNSVADSLLGARAAGMTFEEKMAVICSQRGVNGFWDTLVARVSGGSKDIENDLKGLEDNLDAFGNNIGEITNDDIPKMMDSLAKGMNMSRDEFARWAERNPTKFRGMLDEMLSAANSKVPGLVSRLREVAYAVLNIAQPKEIRPSGEKPYKSGLAVGTPAEIIRNRMKKGGFSYRTDIDPMMRQLKANSWEDFGKNVRTKYKEERNEVDARKSAKVPYNERKPRLLEAIAAEAGISLDVGENKVTDNYGKGSNKSDEELHSLQKKLQSFKQARQTYQKYKEIMGTDTAKDVVLALFPEVNGLDFNDYEGSIKSLLKGFDANLSEERKKFLSDTNKELADWRFSEILKPEWERISQDFEEALNKGVSQFSLYKEILEKTGSKEYAMRAFGNGVLWDEQSSDLARQFKELTGMDVDVNASDATAKHFLVEELGNQKAYTLWKKIVDLVSTNYNESLKKSADIIKETLGYEEQITAVVEKYKTIIDAANESGDRRAAIAATQARDKEVGDINLKKFKNSEDYLNFYGAIYTFGTTKAREVANKIRQNLNKALADGSISAREYGKEIENLQKQLDKLSGAQPSFLNGGLNGIVQSMQNRGQSQMTAGQNKYDYFKKLKDVAEQKGDTAGVESAKEGMEAGQEMSKGGEELMQGASEMGGTISMIDTIIHGINDLVQGLNDTFQDIKETAEALGQDTSTDDWTDANTFFSGFAAASDSATKGWDSLKSGNIGGVISGVVGSFTEWIKAFAAGHDAKLENQIKIAERQVKLLQNIYSNTQDLIENTLGGVYNYQTSDYSKDLMETLVSNYEKRQALEEQLNGTHITKETIKNVSNGAQIGHNVGSLIPVVGTVVGTVAGAVVGGIKSIFGNSKKKLKKEIRKIPKYSEDTYEQTKKALTTGAAYDTELASLMAQRDQIQRQWDAENGKKKKSQDKLDDYEKQLEDMRLQIETFAQDFLESVYSVDIKSWASELTDAVVSAWQNGEDAAQAYHDKAKELVTDLTKNILSQKIMEQALQPVLNYLTEELNNNSGLLSEDSIIGLGRKLNEAGVNAVANITNVLEMLKKNGWDLSDSDGSGSTTNSIKNITEETADILASYINSIRLDVSVNRDNIQKIADAIVGIPEMNIVARSQLENLNQLVNLASYRNEVLDDIYSWMRNVSDGTRKVYVA